MRNFPYFFRMGWQNLAAARPMALASVGSLAACMWLAGAALLLCAHLWAMADQVGGRTGITLFLEPGGDAELAAVLLEEMEEVRFAEYASAQDNLLRMCGRLGETPESLLAHPGHNPFLASFQVEVSDPALHAEAVEKLWRIPGALAVRGEPRTAELLTGFGRAAESAAGVALVILAGASALVLWGTLRLAAVHRRREVAVMRSVGATRAFIRVPFLVEGVLIGLCAALPAWLSLWGGFMGIAYGLRAVEQGAWAPLVLSAAPGADFWLRLAGGFALAGVTVGTAGSWLATRPILRERE